MKKKHKILPTRLCTFAVLHYLCKLYQVPKNGVFFRTHAYLVEHTHAPVRRALMDEIDWNDRLIGIKGTRGVGKTTFLLQYAKEHFHVEDRKCLYINLNNFYFSGQGHCRIRHRVLRRRRKSIADRPSVQTTGLEHRPAQMLRHAAGTENPIHRLFRHAAEDGEPGTERTGEIHTT